uniref:BZIP domain-containing protein n=1 Tax=Gasterosteus aculeatus aculeatus TaxID=481459 RepID=A0AAQ4R549_GASAC
MITRRRRTVNHTAVQPLEVEVVETVKGFSSPPESFPCDDMSNAGLELDDLFGIEDLKWTLERETASSLFDIELANLGFSAKDQDSEIEASTASSPDRTSSDSRIKKRQSQSSHMINKNAVAARLNRLRKKEYVTSLEKKVGVLSSENNVLRHENSQLTKRVEELEDETRYLRAVLANESMLAQLLSRLSGVNGMKLSSSLFQGPNSNDHDYAMPRKRAKVEEKETAGGVCLHVDKNHVSVEFCTKCAESASTSLKIFF